MFEGKIDRQLGQADSLSPPPKFDTNRLLTGASVDVFRSNASHSVPAYFASLEDASDSRTEFVRTFLPELGLLLGTEGLGVSEVQECLSRIGAADRIVQSEKLSALAQRILTRFASIAFSFPEWRFLAMPLFSEMSDRKISALESVGMLRLFRKTDMRSVDTPEDPPEHCSPHDFGPGFEIAYGAYRVELRRAYICVSHMDQNNPITVLARNSSYHFGRNRLPEAGYVSFKNFDREQLRELTREVICNARHFTSIREIISKPDPQLDPAYFLRQIDSALLVFSEWNGELSRQIFPLSGFCKTPLPHESHGLFYRLGNLINGSDERRSFALAIVDSDSPTFPTLASFPISRESLDFLCSPSGTSVYREYYELWNSFISARRNTAGRCVLLSSINGDVPA